MGSSALLLRCGSKVRPILETGVYFGSLIELELQLEHATCQGLVQNNLAERPINSQAAPSDLSPAGSNFREYVSCVLYRALYGTGNHRSPKQYEMVGQGAESKTQRLLVQAPLLAQFFSSCLFPPVLGLDVELKPVTSEVLLHSSSTERRTRITVEAGLYLSIASSSWG